MKTIKESLKQEIENLVKASNINLEEMKRTKNRKRLKDLQIMNANHAGRIGGLERAIFLIDNEKGFIPYKVKSFTGKDGITYELHHTSQFVRNITTFKGKEYIDSVTYRSNGCDALKDFKMLEEAHK